MALHAKPQYHIIKSKVKKKRKITNINKIFPVKGSVFRISYITRIEISIGRGNKIEKKKLFGGSFKFFHKTIQGIKSFVSGCGCGNYQKLPKHSPLPPQEFRHVYEGFAEVSIPSSRLEIQRSPGDHGRKKTVNRGGYGGSNCNQPRRDSSGRSCLVARKLKELETLDLGNIQHVLDVEEAIHYYSLLKCPVYRAIVDEFFAGIYVEFLWDSAGNAGH